MATIFVGSGGNNANNGSTHALRKLTLAGANAIAVSGDIVQLEQASTFVEALQPVTGVTYRSYDAATSLPGTGRATVAGNTDPTGHRACIYGNGADNLYFNLISFDQGDLLYTTQANRSYEDNTGWHGWTGQSNNVTFENCAFSRLFTALSVEASNSNWVVNNCLVTNVGADAFTFNRYNPDGVGQNFVTISNCTITGIAKNVNNDAGMHGIYTNWNNATILSNSITAGTPGTAGRGGSGISLRFPNAVVDSNLIWDCNTGISFYDYSVNTQMPLGSLTGPLTNTTTSNFSGVGTVWITRTRIYNCAGGIWIDKNAGDQVQYGGNGSNFAAGTTSGNVYWTRDNIHNFVVASNTIQTYTTRNIYDETYGCIGFMGTTGTIKIRNNITIPFSGASSQTGTTGGDHVGIRYTPAAGTYLEDHNWFATTSNNFLYGNTRYTTFAAYKTASGQGASSIQSTTSGVLSAAPAFVPLTGAPGVDAGTTSVDAGVSYVTP